MHLALICGAFIVVLWSAQGLVVRVSPTLGEWTAWTMLPCSATCGTGRQRRARECIGGGHCFGDNHTETFCHIAPCEIGEWQQWSEWSTCSVSCGGGRQQRNRVCTDGHCPGPKQIERVCNVSACKVGTWGKWLPWTNCSRSCGGGRKVRTRECIGGTYCVGQARMVYNCNEHHCSDTF